MATEQIPTSIIADDAVTGAKIENNPTVAGNLTVSGTSTLTGNSTVGGTLATTGAFTASGGIANAGTISAGTIGSGVTGAGLTGGMELWRLNTNVVNDDDPLGNSGGEWTIQTGNQSNSGAETYGTGLVSENNGIWTINENGFYHIKAHLYFLVSPHNDVNGSLQIHVSDTSGSGYVECAEAYNITHGSGADRQTCSVDFMTKITGSAPFNHKYVKLKFDTNDANGRAVGSSTSNFTYIIFHKISDV